MGRKKKELNNVQSAHPTWVVSDKIQINGRTVTMGTELSIRGESGRFRFIKHVKTPDSEWIDVIGGKKNYEMWRSFAMENIKTVHRLNRTKQNSES
jgi:hypothetical protein